MLNYLVIGQAAIGSHKPDLRAHADFSCAVNRLTRHIANWFARD